MGTSCCEGNGSNFENQNIVVFDSNEFRINNSNLRNSNVLLRESVSRQDRIKNYRESLFDKDVHNENEIKGNNNSIGIQEETNKEMCRPFEKDEQIKIDSERTDIDVNGIKNLNKNEELSNSNNTTTNNNEISKMKGTKKTKLSKKKHKNNIENIDTNNKCKDIFEKYKYIFEKPQIIPEKRLRSKSKLNNTTNQSIISNQTNNPNQQFQSYNNE